MALEPLTLLRKVKNLLASSQAHYCVAGGVAASLFRARPRLTNDLDIAIDAGGVRASREAAEKIIERLGWKSSLGWIAGLQERSNATVALVIGKNVQGKTSSQIDFLLPALPWVAQAVKRAQSNRIDYGFAELPTLAPEDLIIAKLFALSLEPTRFQDLDDLKEMFQAENDLDLALIKAGMLRFKLSMPKVLRAFCPVSLRRV